MKYKNGHLYETVLELGPKSNLFKEIISLTRDETLGLAQRLADEWGIDGSEVLIDVPVPLSKGRIDLQVLHPSGSLSPWRGEIGWTGENEIDPRRVRVFIPPALADRRFVKHVDKDLMGLFRER